MFPTLLKTFFQCINFHKIMTYFFNIILGIFSIKDRQSRKSLLDERCEFGLGMHTQPSPQIFLRSNTLLRQDLLPTLIGMHALDILHPK
jgi:hypothetical protein